MTTPHKNAEVIKAWADGKEIEVRHDGKWQIFTYCPLDEHREFRIKKEKIVQYINIYPDTTYTCFRHENKDLADELQGVNRIACVRLEFYAGQFDE